MTNPDDRITAQYVASYIDTLIPHIQQIFTTREQTNRYILKRPNIVTYQRTYRWLWNLLTNFDKSIIRRDGRIIITFRVPILSIQHCVPWNLFFRRVLFDSLAHSTTLCRIVHLQNRITSDRNPNRAWNYRLIRNPRNNDVEQAIINTEIWRESDAQLRNLQVVVNALQQNQAIDPVTVIGSGRVVDYIQEVQDGLNQQTDQYHFTVQIGLRIRSNINQFVIPAFITARINNLYLPSIPNPQQDDDDNNNDDDQQQQPNRIWMLLSRPERDIILQRRQRGNRINAINRRHQLRVRRTRNILNRLRRTLPPADYNFLRAQIQP